MNGLSYSVIRVNTEDKNSALTVQDVGHVMPGGEDHGGGRGEYICSEMFQTFSVWTPPSLIYHLTIAILSCCSRGFFVPLSPELFSNPAGCCKN